MIHNTLGSIANSNAHHSIIPPSTTITTEISIFLAIIPSILVNTLINLCRTVVTSMTFTAVVIITTITMLAINTTVIIITSIRLL